MPGSFIFIVFHRSHYMYFVVFPSACFTCICFTISLCGKCSSWARDMQRTSPPFSLDTEPDPRNPLQSVWSSGRALLVSRRSPTTCVSAATCAGPCQCNNPTHRPHPTPSLSELRASRSQIRTTEEEGEEDKACGDGPPFTVETPLPDVEREMEGLQE